MIELFLQEDIYMTKEERAAKRAAKKEAKKNKPGLLAEFKAFISRGNAFDLAVGVVIGGAFSAIVTALVNILLSVATWGIPGGLASLVTVLPTNPANQLQRGLEINGEFVKQFAASDFDKMVGYLGGDMIAYTKLTTNYTKYGAQWVFNGAAVINWGALINAVISFIIVAVILFIIIKAMSVIRAKRDEAKAKALEAHYKKHPEDRPAPVEPGLPEPTEKDILVQIRDLLKAKK